MMCSYSRVILCTLVVISAFAQRGRYMPPPAVECDRNHLTSYTGEVTRYSRKGGSIRLTLHTDAGTTETVSLRAGDKVLLNSDEMKEEDWKYVEEKEGKLKAGMRATAWICEGGRPVLDWQPPKR
jgi:hypothetical protein